MPRTSDKAKAKKALEEHMVAEILYEAFDSFFDGGLDIEDPTDIEIESLAQGGPSFEEEIYDEVFVLLRRGVLEWIAVGCHMQIT